MITYVFLGAILLVLIEIAYHLHVRLPFIEGYLADLRAVVVVIRDVMYIEYPHLIGKADHSIDAEKWLLEELEKRAGDKTSWSTWERKMNAGILRQPYT
jgi:hypothetical protein